MYDIVARVATKTGFASDFLRRQRHGYQGEADATPSRTRGLIFGAAYGISGMHMQKITSSHHLTQTEVKRGDTGEFDSQWRFGVYNLDNDGKLIWDGRCWVWIHFDLPEPQTDAHASFCRALAATSPVRFQRAPG